MKLHRKQKKKIKNILRLSGLTPGSREYKILKAILKVSYKRVRNLEHV